MEAVMGREQPSAASLRGAKENLWFHPLESSTRPAIVRGLPGRFHALPTKSEEKPSKSKGSVRSLSL